MKCLKLKEGRDGSENPRLGGLVQMLDCPYSRAQGVELRPPCGVRVKPVRFVTHMFQLRSR